MKSFVAATLAVAVSAISETEFAFMNYISEYGKNYSSIQEYEFRLAQFVRTHEGIIAENADPTHTYVAGHNKMSDWTPAEYKALLTYTAMPESEKNYEDFEPVVNASPIDWRSKGDVQAIKDQGQCGSCWAFSTISAVESGWRIKHGGALQNLSEQLLVDCDTGCYGCNGGWQYKGFNYFKTHGAMTESSYPYTARDGSCKYSSNNTGVKTTGYTNVSADNPTAMKNALANQPIAVSIEADKFCFQSYSSGIFNNSTCGTRLDHATNVVGWGTSGSTEYWIMRNSWGKSWGESGYMRLEIASGKGYCGIQMEPLYPIMA